MCSCDYDYSGDGLNCTGMPLITHPAGIDYAAYLHSC